MWEYPPVPLLDIPINWPEVPDGARNGDVFRVIDGELFKVVEGEGPPVEDLETK